MREGDSSGPISAAAAINKRIAPTGASSTARRPSHSVSYSESPFGRLRNQSKRASVALVITFT